MNNSKVYAGLIGAAEGVDSFYADAGFDSTLGRLELGLDVLSPAGAVIGLAFMAAFLYAPMPRFAAGLMSRLEAWAPGMIVAAFFFASVTVADNFDDIRKALGMTKGVVG